MATRIPAKTVTWYGVFRRMHLFSGRMLMAVCHTESDCRTWIKETLQSEGGDPNNYMIDPVAVKMPAYSIN